MAQPSGDAVTIDKQTPTDKSEDLVASPVKRGRGRPPKGDGPRVPKTPSSGIKRPRGRPPKVTENGVSSNETQTNDDTPLAKKPRGRPVGSSKKSPKDSPTKGAGKGRGRPPGSTNNPFRIRLSPKKTPKKTDDASGEGTSKGRGRPKIPDELKRTVVIGTKRHKKFVKLNQKQLEQEQVSKNRLYYKKRRKFRLRMCKNVLRRKSERFLLQHDQKVKVNDNMLPILEMPIKTTSNMNAKIHVHVENNSNTNTCKDFTGKDNRKKFNSSINSFKSVSSKIGLHNIPNESKETFAERKKWKERFKSFSHCESSRAIRNWKQDIELNEQCKKDLDFQEQGDTEKDHRLFDKHRDDLMKVNNEVTEMELEKQEVTKDRIFFHGKQILLEKELIVQLALADEEFNSVSESLGSKSPANTCICQKPPSNVSKEIPDSKKEMMFKSTSNSVKLIQPQPNKNVTNTIEGQLKALLNGLTCSNKQKCTSSPSCNASKGHHPMIQSCQHSNEQIMAKNGSSHSCGVLDDSQNNSRSDKYKYADICSLQPKSLTNTSLKHHEQEVVLRKKILALQAQIIECDEQILEIEKHLVILNHRKLQLQQFMIELSKKIMTEQHDNMCFGF